VTSDTTLRAPSPRAYDGTDTGKWPVWQELLRWECALLVVLVVVLVLGSVHSSTFLSGGNLFFIGVNVGEVAIMALPLLLIVMTGEIDLSVASMLGLSGTMMGYLFHGGWNIYLAMAAALVIGALGGALNGFLIAKMGLPSIAVTIGTLTLFRGIAEILLAPRIITGFPVSLTNVGVVPIAGTEVGYSAAIFLVFAVICGIVLHATPLGRSLVAIGLQPEAAQFSGIRVNRVKFFLYVLSGVVCALAGILFALKNASVSYDAGTGLELNVVAVVLFGGISIFGGRGTVIGVVLSVTIFGCLLQLLTQMGIKAEVQNIITGGLLLVSVIVPNAGEALRRIRARTRRRT
jgi:rhamnose transport system permease protein